MTRILDFFDGFTSSTTPGFGSLSANSIACFANEAAFSTYLGRAFQCGDIYYDDALNLLRVHDGTVFNEYPAKGSNEIITGQWTFNDNIKVAPNKGLDTNTPGSKVTLAANGYAEISTSGQTSTVKGSLQVDENVVVTGDLTVNGNTTTLNVSTHNVEDKNITINNGGNDASAEGAGLTVDRTGTDGSLIYVDAAASKWKAGALGSEIELANISSSQALTNKTIDADLNTISNIDNNEIKAAANIALTKLAALSANKALVSDGSGTIATAAVTSTELLYLSGVTSGIQSQINGKVSKSGDTMTGALDMGANKVTTTYIPLNNEDLVNKAYADTIGSGVYVAKAGDSMTGDLNMAANTGVNTSTLNGKLELGINGYVEISKAGQTSYVKGSLSIDEDLTVSGSAVSLDVASVNVEANHFLMNNGGNDASAEGAGFDVNRVSTHGSFKFDSTKASKWKLGLLGSEVEVADVSSSQSLTNKTIDADLNTLSNIENADIKTGAAIDRSKLASGTADHVIINNGSGVLSSEATLATTRGGTGLNSYTTGDVIYSSASNTLSKLPIGSTGQVLTVSGGIPAWSAAGGSTADLDSMMTKGFQGFVDETSLLTPKKNSAGSPGSGEFRTYEITGRASIPDLANDLRTRFGVERIPFQQLYEIQTESGANGEKVFGLVNDTRNLIRFVGEWTATQGTLGEYISCSADGNYIEIVFYGNALNFLMTNNAASYQVVANVDGGADSANLIPTFSSPFIPTSRNANPNTIFAVPGISGTGLHTVKLRRTSTGFPITGIEIINDAATLSVRPGSGYQNGKKLTLGSVQTPAYGSTFETGSINTRSGNSTGGRVLTYIKSDSTIAKSLQAVTGASVLTLGSTDHTDEEVARVYYWREFGKNFTNDFSTFTSFNTNLFWTLDDGTTTLVTNAASLGGFDGLRLTNDSTSWISLTFVGCGVDLITIAETTGTAKAFAFSYDGGSSSNTATPSVTAGQTYIFPLVSGLPYGTHIVRLLKGSGGADMLIKAFKVYQPKKPTLPTGAIELSDYNLMAEFVANSTAGLEKIASGVIRKTSNRELKYIGTTWAINTGSGSVGGCQTNATANGAYFEYTFFGSGFEFRADTNTGRSNNITVTIDGLAATTANFPGLTTSLYGGFTLVSSSPSYVFSQNTASVPGSGLVMSGLGLAVHTVRLTTNNSPNNFLVEAFDVVTPVHSHKPTTFYDIDNTNPVGNYSILDSRKVSPVKSEDPKKNYIQVIYGPTEISTTSTSAVPTDLQCAFKTKGGMCAVTYSIDGRNTSNSGRLVLYVDGFAVGSSYKEIWVGGYNATTTDRILVNLSPGTHYINVYYYTFGGNTFYLSPRSMTVEEL